VADHVISTVEELRKLAAIARQCDRVEPRLE
jgi:hypothetical protein